MKLKNLGILIGVPILVFVFAIALTDQNFQNNPNVDSEKNYPKITHKGNVTPPNTRLDIIKDYSAIVKTTAGDFTIKINNLDTPVAAANFVYLSRIGFYDDLYFHRVIKDFMIQTGDPKGDGTGGPGYYFNDEPFDMEYQRGVVAMANSGANTNGSQFFILQKDNFQLPKKYIAFGKVIDGMDTIDRIADAPVEDNGFGEISKPVNPVKILSIKIIEE